MQTKINLGVIANQLGLSLTGLDRNHFTVNADAGAAMLLYRPSGPNTKRLEVVEKVSRLLILTRMSSRWLLTKEKVLIVVGEKDSDGFYRLSFSRSMAK